MEMANTFDFAMLWNFFSSVIFHLVTLGVCVYYIIRKQNIDGFLLSTGAFIHILTSTFYSLILPIMARSVGPEIYSRPYLLSVAGIISLLGSLVYIIGFIILVINHVSLYQRIEEQKSQTGV